MVDTGAGFLLRTGESKARERRFFQPKEFDEEMCLDCQLPFRNSELRYYTHRVQNDTLKPKFYSRKFLEILLTIWYVTNVTILKNIH